MKKILASNDYAQFAFPQNEGSSYSFTFILIDGDDIIGVRYTYESNEPSSNFCKWWTKEEAEKFECERDIEEYVTSNDYEEDSRVPGIVSDLFEKQSLSHIFLRWSDGHVEREEY